LRRESTSYGDRRNYYPAISASERASGGDERASEIVDLGW
jgi:hypothetical protein